MVFTSNVLNKNFACNNYFIANYFAFMNPSISTGKFLSILCINFLFSVKVVGGPQLIRHEY